MYKVVYFFSGHSVVLCGSVDEVCACLFQCLAIGICDCCSRTHCCTVIGLLIIVIFCDFTIRFSITGLQRARC